MAAAATAVVIYWKKCEDVEVAKETRQSLFLIHFTLPALKLLLKYYIRTLSSTSSHFDDVVGASEWGAILNFVT